MASINIYLREDLADRKGRGLLYLVVQHKGKKFASYTKEKVESKFWDKEKQRVKSTKSGYKSINAYLDDQIAQVEGILRELRFNNTPVDIQLIRDRFKGTDQKPVDQEEPEKTPPINFFQFLDEYLNHSKDTLGEQTLKSTRTLVKDLIEFQEKYKLNLSFESFDIRLYNQFVSFLTEERECSHNTVSKKIAKIKTVLNYATQIGLNTKLDFREFSVKRMPTDKIYLTREELHNLYKLDLSFKKNWEQVRDVFCFACFTGLRFSDITQLQASHIKQTIDQDGKFQKYIEIVVTKTRKKLTVPLIAQEALSILEKYEGKLARCLPVISNQKTNQHIKEIGEMAGITDVISKVTYIGNRRKEEEYPKYQLITTHTARHTFITLSLEQGMRAEVVQSIVGHASMKQLMAYVRIIDPIKFQEMDKAWN